MSTRKWRFGPALLVAGLWGCPRAQVAPALPGDPPPVHTVEVQPNAAPTCGEIVLIGTRAQIAMSPRFDKDAERLALRTTEELIAPQDRYERIAADLTAIRTFTKDPGARHVEPRFGTDSVMLEMAHENILALDEDRYKGLECLNSWYGGRHFNALKAMDMEMVSFTALFHPKRITELYGQHPDVRVAHSIGGAFGSGENITLCNASYGGTHTYLFHRGSGDCLSGCIHWVFRGYSVTEAGQVTPLPSWETDSPHDKTSRPDWVTEGCFRHR